MEAIRPSLGAESADEEWKEYASCVEEEGGASTFSNILAMKGGFQSTEHEI